LAEAVIDSLPNPIFVKDETLTFVMANKAFADFFGTLTSRQIVGQRAGNLVGPDEATDFEAERSATSCPAARYSRSRRTSSSTVASQTRMVRKNRVTTGGTAAMSPAPSSTSPT
jgi:PAS domain-containing protein